MVDAAATRVEVDFSASAALQRYRELFLPD
jgi:hypothetical protein